MAADAPGRLGSGEPSATAMGVAIRRAAHQLIDQPLVFADPLAAKIIGSSALERLKAELEHHRHPFNLALRAHVVARSRYAEDRLAEAHARGVRQCLVLGAGLDTFAWRNPYPDLTVFEVDHPSTQAWKRACLAAMGAAEPDTLVFAPVDFQSQSLAEGLSAAGFAWDRPAFVSWLGVTMYLPEAAVMRTLGDLAALPAGSEAVFDFSLSPEGMEPLARAVQEALAARVAAAGEPFLSAFDPEALAGQLKALGFLEVEILDGRGLNRLYFEGRTDGLRLADASRLARARL